MGMINIQEQMQIGFKHISSELRSLSSSVEPPSQRRISNPVRKSIEQKPIENRRLDDDYSEINSDNEQDGDIEEINPVYEDCYSDEKEYKDSKLQEEEAEAQKKLVKKKRKEIKVCFVNSYYTRVIL